MTEITAHLFGEAGHDVSLAGAPGASRSVEEILYLALDLCIGIGAFAVGLTGSVHEVVSDAMPPEDAQRRLEALARSCLTHPAAAGHDVFWNAEVSTEAESAERSLACVVMPVWIDDVQVGLLGVADTWLPEPDDEQRAGLAELGRSLGRLLPTPRHQPTELRNGAVAPVGDVEGTAPPEGHGGDPLMASVVRNLPEAVLVVRSDGTVVLVNEAFAALVGVSSEQLAGKDVSGVLAAAPTFERSPTASLVRLIEEAAPAQRLYVLRDGAEPLAVDAVGSRLLGSAMADCTVALVRPLSSSRSADVDVSVDDLVESLDDGVLCLDATGRVVLANRAANALHGLAPHRSLVGSPLPPVSALRTEDGQVLAHDHHPGLKVLRDGSAVMVGLRLGEESQGQRHLSVSARPFAVGGGVGALVVFHDTTAEWMEQQRLTHYALHDPLTNLANRYLLLEELRRMLQGLGRRGGSVALVFLDLDNFKLINDRYGHDVGDEVLTAVARRLKGAVRSDDVVARLGGDEFVIAHASSEQLADGELVVSRIRKVLSAPFRVRGDVFDVAASIGWVSTDTDDIGPDALLAKADRAMYRHKRDRAVPRHAGE